MKFAVFGATGQTGLEVVKQALSAGHQVTAFVRTPSKITIQDEKLKVEEADVFDEKSFTEKLAGHDSVFSCLGFKPEKPAVTGYTKATKCIVEGMKANNLKRLVLCHSWYTNVESRSSAWFPIRWFLIPMIRPVLDNMLEVENWLEAECPEIDFTVVRPAGLTNSPVTTGEIKVNVGGYHVEGAAGRIARADVARFMLDCDGKDEYKRKQLSIGI